MGETLYLEAYSGISGGMIAGALIDLGADRGVLEKALGSLSFKGVQVRIARERRGRADTCNVQKTYGSGGIPSRCSVSDMLAMIREADMAHGARRMAERMAGILAEGEAGAQGAALAQIDFDGRAAFDAVVDMVAAAVCLDCLGTTQALVPRLYEGCGLVTEGQEFLPVPLPTVVQIAMAYGLPVEITSLRGPLVTPAAAAIVAAVRRPGVLPCGMEIQKIGLGSGEAPYSGAGFLRAMLVRPQNLGRDSICKLESNIDDCTGESLGYVMERLMAAGARDVHYTPVYMKKNRPAYQLNVVCTREDVPKMERIIFEEPTTIGIRHMEMERSVLRREGRTIKTSLGEAKVKLCELGAGTRVYPEYESVKELCEKNHLAFQEVYDRIKREGEESRGVRASG